MRLYLSYELRCHHLGPTLLFNLALQTKKKASQIWCAHFYFRLQNYDNHFARVNAISDFMKIASQTLLFRVGIGACAQYVVNLAYSRTSLGDERCAIVDDLTQS